MGFLSTPSARRATIKPDRETVSRYISIHALREEGDRQTRLSTKLSLNFYPRPPRGGRLFLSCYSSFLFLFLSTPSARRATVGAGALILAKPISIHALREEGDDHPAQQPPELHNFYPRPPRGGRHLLGVIPDGHADFYPRPPRGGRLPVGLHDEGVGQFLSTPSARRATRPCLSLLTVGQFLSTPSARRATDHRGHRPRRRLISIHALREEGDAGGSCSEAAAHYFYPRPPRGGRQLTGLCPFHEDRFLSTPSARRATLTSPAWAALRAYFYPRPPRGGRHIEGVIVFTHRIFLSTPSARRATGNTVYIFPSMLFLSTPSARRATRREVALNVCKKISIHALREEGDVRTLHLQAVPEISIHALREEGDPDGQPRHLRRQISIHALREEGDLRSAVSLLFW